MDFLESDRVANPVSFLKQVISDGLVISLQRSSVGYQGIEPRYLKVHFIRTITPICSIPLHLSILTCVIYRRSYYSIAHIKKPFQPDWKLGINISTLGYLEVIFIHLKYSTPRPIRILLNLCFAKHSLQLHLLQRARR